MIKYNTILPASGDATRIGGIPKFLLPLFQGSLLKILINKCQSLTNNNIFIPTQPQYLPMIYQYISDNNIFIIGLKTQTMVGKIILK